MAEKLLADLPQDTPLSIAGFSMGGAVAAEMVHQAPDRIASLALLSSNPRSESSIGLT
jgi:pimeloyl-ACP methyl ester carboxylesterase